MFTEFKNKTDLTKIKKLVKLSSEFNPVDMYKLNK